MNINALSNPFSVLSPYASRFAPLFRRRTRVSPAIRVFRLSLALLASPLDMPAVAAPLVIKLGTLAPTGSPWHQMVLQIGEEWARISGGQVTLRIYAGGVLGDEEDLVRKMRIGQIQAVAVSTSGLAILNTDIMCLQIPLMFDSWAELDAVEAGLIPKLAEGFARHGSELLTWTEGGWVHFFTQERTATIDEMRTRKLFVWAGHPTTEEFYTRARFRTVPLAVTDMLPGLHTGLITALDVPPLAALLNQWFGVARYMVDLNWAPLLGGVIVDRRTWETVPAAWREPMRHAAVAASARWSRDIRRLGEEAVPAMVARGLTVVSLDAATRAGWRRDVEALYPAFRGQFGTAEDFDKIMQLRTTFRGRLAAR